jgi:exodeoxyribonuclease VII small subunit
MPRKKSNGQQEPPECFEEALTELAEIVGHLEDGSVGLEESLALFEKGMGLLRHCQQVLSLAEQRIEQLIGFDADGNAVTEPLDGAATIDQRKESAGRRQRAPRNASTDDSSTGEEDEDPGPRLF